MTTRSKGEEFSAHESRVGAGAVRRGAMLLEVVVALAVFVVAALAVLGAVQRATSAAVLARDQSRAVDLARSAIAKIESGIARAESLNGPVPAWGDGAAGENASGAPLDGVEISGAFRDTPAKPSGWELEIRTQPTSYDGLTAVTVVARRRRGTAGDVVSASFTLTQFMRLGARGGDASAGDAESDSRVSRGPFGSSGSPGRARREVP